MIDGPIIGLINGFNKLPYCFTLQSCYEHFVYKNLKEKIRNEFFIQLYELLENAKKK